MLKAKSKTGDLFIGLTRAYIMALEARNPVKIPMEGFGFEGRNIIMTLGAEDENLSDIHRDLMTQKDILLSLSDENLKTLQEGMPFKVGLLTLGIASKGNLYVAFGEDKAALTKALGFPVKEAPVANSPTVH